MIKHNLNKLFKMMRQFVLISLAMQFAITTAQSDLLIAGRVVVARGEAEVVHADGSRETLARRSEIRVGDTINTTANAWIQIRFIDSAILSLNCNSSLRINQYQYEDRNSDRADLYLQRGRIRTITGSIQRVNYQFVTDVANVYIGGTDFGIEAESAFSYVFGVYDGTIRVGNSYGQVLLGVGSDYIFARAEAGTSPIVLPYDPFSSPTLILGDTAC